MCGIPVGGTLRRGMLVPGVVGILAGGELIGDFPVVPHLVVPVIRLLLGLHVDHDRDENQKNWIVHSLVEVNEAINSVVVTALLVTATLSESKAKST